MSYLSSLNASTLLAHSSLTKGTERAAVSMERLIRGKVTQGARLKEEKAVKQVRQLIRETTKLGQRRAVS